MAKLKEYLVAKCVVCSNTVVLDSDRKMPQHKHNNSHWSGSNMCNGRRYYGVKTINEFVREAKKNGK